MNEPVGTELSASARQVIADARGADDPTAEDEARVKARWLAGIAAGAGVSSLSEAVRAAATTGWGLKAGALAAALAAATAGLYLGWPQPLGPAHQLPPPAPAVVATGPAAPAAEPALSPAPAPAAAEAAIPAAEAPAAPAVAEAPAAPADEAAAEPAPPPSASEAVAPVRAPTAAARSAPVPQRPRATARATKAPVPAPVEAAVPVAPSVAAPAASGQLGEELSLISQIRGQLQAGAASGALEQLTAYRRRFERPHLAMEADALQVDALCKSGDREGARAAAAVFTTTWPASPLQQRVSAACP